MTSTNSSEELAKLAGKIPTIKHLLTARDYIIVGLRLGYDNGQRFTLREIGDRFGVSGECIRKIEMNALRLIRNRENVIEDNVYCPYLDGALPCPFCGCEKILAAVACISYVWRKGECARCGSSGGRVRVDAARTDPTKKRKEDVSEDALRTITEEWNKRA